MPDDSEMRALPALLLARVREVLGDNLVGFYVVGSLVTGDFDARSSDVDLIAVTAADLDDAEYQRLAQMHADIVRDQPELHDRIEIIYISAARLKGDQSHYDIVITSPGEPFHVRPIRHDEWTINWYVLREKSVVLFGLDPRTLVAPIAQAEIIRVVRALARQTPGWLTPSASLGYQGYVILTLCRSLRLVRTSEFVSKPQAASWAAALFPEWAELIHKTLEWRVVEREDSGDDPAAVFPETLRLIHALVEQIERP